MPPEPMVFREEFHAEVPEDWMTMRGIYAEVRGAPVDRQAVFRIHRHSNEAIPRLAKEMGLPTGAVARIYLADSRERFKTIQPSPPSSWADATAWPAQGLVFLRSPRIRKGTDDPLEQVLDHEIVHVLLGQGFHNRPVPRWLQEGMAQVLAGQYTPEVTRRIARGMLGSDLMDLRSLAAGFPADPLKAQLAYAQSADLVAWIRQEHGEEAMRTLVRELAGGTPIGAAIRSATGRSLEDIDEEWRARLGSSHLWFAALADQAVFWGFGGLLLILGAWRIKRRNRRRMKRLEAEEDLSAAIRGVWIPAEAEEARRRSHLELVVDNGPSGDRETDPGDRETDPGDRETDPGTRGRRGSDGPG